MAGKKEAKRLAKYVPDYVVFDLETTGISCVNDQIIEISAVKAAGGKVRRRRDNDVLPGMLLSAGRGRSPVAPGSQSGNDCFVRGKGLPGRI